MDGLIGDIEAAFSDFSWTNLLEVAVIALVLYAVLRLLRGTTAMSIVRGVVLVVVLMTVVGRSVNSVVLNWIVDNALAVLLIVVLLVFSRSFAAPSSMLAGRAACATGSVGVIRITI